MSSTTWTVAELQSKQRLSRGKCWRIVESQHYISTQKITENNHEQDVIEKIIEETKPRIPEECKHLNYLLYTPFRYGAGYPRRASRFRRTGSARGAFYASDDVVTAIAEMTFIRILFFAESPLTTWPTVAEQYRSFSATYATGRCLDIRRNQFLREPSLLDPVDYSACHALADRAREAGVQMLRYTSVRDPQRRPNVALLTCSIFTASTADDLQSWHITLGSAGARVLCEAPRWATEFDRTAFANDPRIAACKWDR